MKKTTFLAGSLVAAIFTGSLVLPEDNLGDVGKLSLYYKKDNSSTVCGISRPQGYEGILLTAAHCIDDASADKVFINNQPIRGKAIAQDAYEFPNFDIAVVYAPSIAKTLDTVKIAPESIYQDISERVKRGEIVKALSVGYGTTELREIKDDTGAVVMRVPDNVSADLKKLDVVISYINSRIIKVRDPLEKGGACVGDSGSPLFYDDGDGDWYILAVTSSVEQNEFGEVCTKQGYETSYTSLLSYLDWIQDVNDFCNHNEDQCLVQ